MINNTVYREAFGLTFDPSAGHVECYLASKKLGMQKRRELALRASEQKQKGKIYGEQREKDRTKKTQE